MNRIGLVIYAKNEEAGLEQAILSALPYVDTVTVWDTGSTDGTLEIAKKYADFLYTLRVPPDAMDFGMITSMAIRLTPCEWSLQLDGDETLEGGHLLRELVETEYDVWGFARYRWADLTKTVQLEKEAFPDYQYRLIRNDHRTWFRDFLHQRIETPHLIGRTLVPFINHFVDPLHLSNPVRVAERARLYEILAQKAGKNPEGSEEAMRLAGHI